MDNLEDILAVSLIFGSPVVIVLIVTGFRLLRYTQRQRTIRLAMEKGADISAFLAEEVATFQPRQYFLRGLLWGLAGLLIGAGVTWAAIQDGHHPYAAIFGWIPAAIDLAYLIFYRWGLARNGGTGDASPSTTHQLPPNVTTL